MRKLITILIVTLAAISCGNIRDAHNTLNDIETFINEQPDSALTILDSFDASLLDNKSVWAHHSLLHAQAKDKCYIDETDDSLMAQVVNYYEGKRDKEKLFKAYYYLGRIQYNAEKYSESMLSYTRAEQLIDEIDNDVIKGLLYAQLGILHHKYFDYQRSTKYYEMALLCFDACGMKNYTYYIKLDIGLNNQEEKQYTAAEQLFNEVMVWAYENQHLSLCQEALGFLVSLYDETTQIDKSIKLINSKYGKIKSDNIFVLRGKSLESSLNGDHENYMKYRQKFWDHSTTLSDSINNYYYEYKTAKILGNYDIALSAHEKIQSMQDSILLKSMKYPLLAIKNNFLQSENQHMQEHIRRNKAKIVIIFVMLVLIAIIALLIFRHKIAIKNMEIIRYVEAAEDLEITIINKCKELAQVNAQNGTISAELEESNMFISTMLSKQYALLNKLTSTYYETHGCNKDKEAIYRYVSKEIERLSSDKIAIQQLEELVNSHKGNIMIKIRDFLPHLTEMEYRLLCYLCVGFSAKAISIFTGDSTNNIYVKKSRIKNEIMKLDPSVRQSILNSINSQETNVV